MTRPVASRIRTPDLRSRGGHLNHLANETSVDLVVFTDTEEAVIILTDSEAAEIAAMDPEKTTIMFHEIEAVLSEVEAAVIVFTETDSALVYCYLFLLSSSSSY